VAEHANRNARRPSAADRKAGWEWLTDNIDLDPNDKEARELFESTWRDEEDWLWSKYRTADPNVGPRLRDIVKESGLTVIDVSKGTGANRTYIYKVFGEDSNPTADIICKILNETGNTWSALDYPRRRMP
jgi:DNA-binding phage protein